MNKTLKMPAFIALLVVAIIVFVIIKNTKPAAPNVPEVTTDLKNASYIVDDQKVTLVKGVSDVAIAPGSATHIITQYFGNEAHADLTADGKDDTVFLLTQSSGGSGTFYYVAAFLSNGVGTNAVLLGDRIAPQTTEIRDGQIIVNYADRAQSDPMATAPSVGVSKYFKVQNGVLVEIHPVDTTVWKTGVSSGLSFMYPKTFSTKYLQAVDFPPKIQILKDPFTCTQAGSETARGGSTSSVVINAHDYCVTKESEGAAGSTYTNYAYAWSRNGGTAILTFTTRQPQCDNYDDPQKTECKTEKANFDIDSIADAIAHSVK